MLTKPQEIFCKELLLGKSQRLAYYVAYPKSKNWKEATVDSKACILAKNGKIKARLSELATKTVDNIDKKCGVDAAYVITNLQEVAERCMQKRNPEDKFDSRGANQALELIGKNLKMFTDRISVDVSENVADVLAKRRAELERMKDKE